MLSLDNIERKEGQNSVWTREEQGLLIRKADEALCRTAIWLRDVEPPRARERLRWGGTAVLIQGDGWQGALTAGHCLEGLEKRGEMSISASRQSRPGTQMQGEIVRRKLLGQAVVEPNKGGTAEGPDLAFVPLSPQVMGRLEDDAGGVAHNVEKDWTRSGGETLNGTLFVAGYVQEHGTEALHRGEAEPGRELAITRRVEVSPDGEGWRSEHGGWDYARFEVVLGGEEGGAYVERNPALPDWLNERTLGEPKTWKGMSGSGVWWVGHRGQREMEMGLCGVVFYETPGDEGKGRKLKAHGPKSLQRLIERVKESRIDYSEPIARVWRNEEQKR